MGVEVICTKLLDKHHDLFIVDEFIRCRELSTVVKYRQNIYTTHEKNF